MAKYNEIRRLAREVENAYEGNHLEEKFLPDTKFQQIISQDNVERAFADAGIPDTKELVQFVLKVAGRIFLVLVLMTTPKEEKLSLLKDLQDRSVDDRNLPIGFKRRDENSAEGFSVENSNTPRFEVLEDDWDRTDRDSFENYQWRLLAPVFGTGQFRYSFNQRRILPYLRIAQKPASEGFFGEVSRIEVHYAHIPVLPRDPVVAGVPIAVKKAKHDETLTDFFDKEANNLEKLQYYQSPFLIKPIAAYQMKQDRCLVFPWADGGNLENYWRDFANGLLVVEDLHWIIGQFVGLCSALEELHVGNVRHGDLKPENILWFKTREEEEACLKIADMGLTTFHEKDANTNIRKDPTQTPSGTSRYEPPEMDAKKRETRSREYDIWSMGCIMLELLVFLIYGYDELKTFRHNTPYFWSTSVQDGRNKMYHIHPSVDLYMDTMEIQLQESTAYKALLNLISTRLLVCPVSVEYISSPSHREIASVLRESLATIKSNCQSNASYLLPLRLRYTPSEGEKRPAKSGIFYEKKNGALSALETSAARSPLATPQIHIPESAESDSDGFRLIVRAPTGDFQSQSADSRPSELTDHQQLQSSQLTDKWKSVPNTEFATEFINLIGWDRLKPAPGPPAKLLCSSCSFIESTRLFESTCDLSTLQLKSRTCPLCKLLFDALVMVEIKLPRSVELRHEGATVGVKDGPDLLSIYAEPGSNIPEDAQLGLPQLLKRASPEQFMLVKEWIRVCDSTHRMCRRGHEVDKDGSTPTMPTRLIAVGETLRLVNSASIDKSAYVALSHCWGPLTEAEKFCTYMSNIADLQQYIDFARLPRTFRDAVDVTRGLGIKYLWIDSLCIIQDDAKDWESEAGKMEQVFSAAYCTIGASSAKSSLEGFLAQPNARPCVQLSTLDKGTTYVCLAVDDFHRDMELSELNRRGWALQERALSRRTIYYTSTQVYWECGAGVHCETLARLENNKAAFLGDANFPKLALEYYRDGRQLLIQDLYERYSALSFSNHTDRSIAILGLQERLARELDTQAAHGLFAVYFARGLLWQRSNVRLMTPIAWPPGHRVPSWSWLSKMGAIKYKALEFAKIEWGIEEFKSPFGFQENTNIGAARARKYPEDTRAGNGGDITILRGLARSVIVPQKELLVLVTFDVSQDYGIDKLRCVIIGRDETGNLLGKPKYHVLIIHQVGRDRGTDMYERVGVASLKRDHIGPREGASWVSIQ
ncbi:hypothetical protein BP6252_13385 [Coleophoma cylindrospora]|uniref:Protein kinase domain-containing protein n=1 Tax=Coleophoma cylindrospora TaxID=1849047 RepID=A0A3D8QAX4_9HELO|nr:hypothetical protein BP6252_13385 [Coleophoma cylindrospora]